MQGSKGTEHRAYTIGGTVQVILNMTSPLFAEIDRQRKRRSTELSRDLTRDEHATVRIFCDVHKHRKLNQQQRQHR
jgi:hypothetical protein